MTLEKSTWRLLLTSPAPGAWNMAVDEAILEAVGVGQSLPTLRLYAWEPPCLSLGYAQPRTDVDFPRLLAAGWQIVRRPTGGRAILHTDELTYAVIAPLKEPRVAGSILESYSRLAQALLFALEVMGLEAQSQEKTGSANNRSTNPVCFEVPSNYEILAAGKKLIGSAQARRKEGVLQHGSLPLTGDLTRITQALVFPNEASRSAAAARLLAHATTVESAFGLKVTWGQAAAAFKTAFSQVLSIDFIQEELSLAERKRALELVQAKYDHPSWNARI